MYIDLFPFELVPRGSRIIIYGFGTTGQHFWRQIKKTKYCDIVCVVDRNYKNLENHFVDVFPVEFFYQMTATEYDLVIVAVGTPEVGESIKNELVIHGILDRIIIVPPEPPMINHVQIRENFSITIERMIHSPECLAEYLDTFWIFREKEFRFARDYYHDVYILIERHKRDKKQEILGVFDKSLAFVKNDEAKIIAIRMLYELDVFDVRLMKAYVSVLKNMTWKDETPYALATDMASMIFEKSLDDCLFQGYYQNQRELYHNLCEYLKLRSGKIQNSISKCVGIFCHIFYPVDTNVCPRLVANYANRFAEMGYDVRIFVTPTLRIVGDKNVFLKKHFWVSDEQFLDMSRMEGTLDPRIEVVHAAGETVKDRLQYMVDQVFDFNPKFILDMADDMAVEVCFLHQFFPTIYIPLRSRSSCMEFDAYITQNAELCRKMNKIYKTIDEDKVFEIRRVNLIKEKEVMKYDRSALGYDADDFLICSVGHRLKYEIDEDLIDKMSTLLKENKNMRWIIVGTIPDSDNVAYNSLIANGQIIPWGLEKHLIALYRICNIYLQPNRSGGAHGIRLAMNEGLPIVMTNFSSDAIHLLNSLYTVCDNYSEMMEKIKELESDCEYYKSQSEKARKTIDDMLKDDGIEKLAALCERISSMKKTAID